MTTPRPGGAACNQRLILAHDASVVRRGEKQVRSECIYRPGMSLAIDRVPSGVYFYRLMAGRYVESRKMILLR